MVVTGIANKEATMEMKKAAGGRMHNTLGGDKKVMSLMAPKSPGGVKLPKGPARKSMSKEMRTGGSR
jgi:hypothetical protein